MLLVFAYVIEQYRRTARLQIEKETSDAENRVKQQELERRLALQEKLLEEEKQRVQQEQMITALASDYWSVYYLELDKDEGICYQSHSDISDGFKAGERFRYLESVTSYANRYITDAYREEFLRFIQPEAIREGLSRSHVISYTYTVHRHGQDSYEMVRFAGVHHPGEMDGDVINNVGACFTDVDAETRRNLEQKQTLSDALGVAEEASKAKSAFLSSMSHEIRTPMNAIIGLDNIALNDPDTPEKTRGYLEKIGASAGHLLNLINDILDMSRIESGRMTLKKEEFSFSRALRDINTLLQRPVQRQGAGVPLPHRGPGGRLLHRRQHEAPQVLINILSNAVKFTPKGGQVRLSCERIASRFDPIHSRFYHRGQRHRHESRICPAYLRYLQSGRFLHHQ